MRAWWSSWDVLILGLRRRRLGQRLGGLFARGFAGDLAAGFAGLLAAGFLAARAGDLPSAWPVTSRRASWEACWFLTRSCCNPRRDRISRV